MNPVSTMTLAMTAPLKKACWTKNNCDDEVKTDENPYSQITSR